MATRRTTATSMARRCSGRAPTPRRIYAWGENNHLKAYKYSQGRLQDVDTPRQSVFRPPHGMPGGMLALSANGSAAGTGILWAVVPLDGDANRQRGVKGIVLALDAQDVSRTLWTSEQFSDRDRLGLFAKFNPPIVANGKVFVRHVWGSGAAARVRRRRASAGVPAQLLRRGLRTARPPPPARVIVNQDRDDVTVVRAQTPPLTLGPNQCTPIDGASVDCTEALAQTAGAPSLHRVVFGATPELCRVPAAAGHDGQQGHGARQQRRASASGARRPPTAIRRRRTRALRAEGALKALGAATLQNGAPATLHEFVGVANCPAGERCRAEPAVQAVHAVRGSGRWQNLPQLGSSPRTIASARRSPHSTGAPTCCGSKVARRARAWQWGT